MKLEPFAMERMQSTYENHVAFNLSESGVHPLTLGELADDDAARAALMTEALKYSQSNGTEPLRAAIAALYGGATIDHVQVTNGGAEANYLTTWNLVETGDEVVVMVPNYMQTPGLARAFGADVREWPLVESSAGWNVDADALARLVSPRTRLMRTVTRRGGITAWASNASALSTIVTSSLARVSPAANWRPTVISTQSGGRAARAGRAAPAGPNG